MDQDRAILTAAFAFRDRPEAPTGVTERLRAILPASLDDVAESDLKPLSERVLEAVTGDIEAMAFFTHAINALKSYGGAKSPIGGIAYRCPYGDQTGTRIDKVDAIPTCTKHNVPMDLV